MRAVQAEADERSAQIRDLQTEKEIQASEGRLGGGGTRGQALANEIIVPLTHRALSSVACRSYLRRCAAFRLFHSAHSFAAGKGMGGVCVCVQTEREIQASGEMDNTNQHGVCGRGVRVNGQHKSQHRARVQGK